MARSTRYSSLARQTSSSPSIDSTSTIWKRASENSGKILIAVQRSDQKFWHLQTVTLASRPDLIITEYRFHIHYMEKGIRKLLYNLDPDLTVGSKVIASTNHYCSLTRPDLLLTEYRFHIHYMEKGILKLM
jgi:hypothetical protein